MDSKSTIAKSAHLRPELVYKDPIHVGAQVIVQALSVGRYCFINNGTCIFNNVEIGNFVSFGRNVQVGGAEHPLGNLTTSFFRYSRGWFPDCEIAQSAPMVRKSGARSRPAKTVLGSDVWIGGNAVVLQGVTINHGAVVGAGAVVTKEVPAYAIVAGNPARIIKYRFDKETIAALLNTRWWDLEIEVIAALPFDDIQLCLEMLQEEMV